MVSSLVIKRKLIQTKLYYMLLIVSERYHGKTTYEWHTDVIWVHTSDIRMTYEYIRVTYGWHTGTYEWHTDDIQIHTTDILMKYKWHTCTYDLHSNDIRNIKLYYGFGAFRSLFSKLFVLKTLLLYCWCKRFLGTRLFPFSNFLLASS